MKIAILGLLGLAFAQENADGVCNANRSCWEGADVKYEGDWKTCKTDFDCEPRHLCLDHMWGYNSQSESGRGCWRENVCAGSGAWDMQDGRNLQFFCSDK